jgi:hypothetical protein
MEVLDPKIGHVLILGVVINAPGPFTQTILTRLLQY